MASDNHIGLVQNSSNSAIRFVIADDVPADDGERILSHLQVYERAMDAGHLQVGNYVQIRQGSDRYVLAVITNVNGSIVFRDREEDMDWTFSIDCQPLGSIDEDGSFSRRASRLPVPLEPVYPVSEETISNVYETGGEFDFYLGKLSINRDISIKLDGDRLFSKHIAVVGSTGSGKSCTVTRILHQAVGIAGGGENLNIGAQKNSHIVIFDLHAEYINAFRLCENQEFSVNSLSVENLILPYWLMNSEELESMFIESNEHNSHNQVSVFKRAVIENKRRHNSDIKERITYDSPVFFSVQEVLNYIRNKNAEVTNTADNGVERPALADDSLLDEHEGESFDELYFDGILRFAKPERGKKVKGTFNGQFSRFISRLDNRTGDKRLEFLMSPQKDATTVYKTDDYGAIVRQYIGYITRSNVTIVDLSGIPFEVLSICISLVSRVLFDFCFQYTKERHGDDKLNDVPVMIVCEEAHNYVPKSDSVMYRPSRKAIERIAKEGRKYGISLMIVSQRPSEVSETIFAQCNNFVALRLTNTNDQEYVKRLLPDNLSSVTDMLPNLGDGECIAIGDAIPLPSVVQMDMPNPQPKSQSVRFHKEWQQDWVEDKFDAVIERLKER